MKEKFESEKGSITVFVLAAMIFVSAVILTVYFSIMNKNGTQEKNMEKIKNEYQLSSNSEMDEAYEKIMENQDIVQTKDTSPFLPDGATVTNNDLATGVTIKDSNGNEWVWIEVPKSIYTNTAYNGGTAPSSSTDYEKIESVMKEYAKDYRSPSYYEDAWYSEEQHGFKSAIEYNNHKNSMLKSVYENGGFYIGKYEVGIKEDTNRFYGQDYESEHPIEQTPVIQEGKYVYNWVRCNQAQELSESLATGGRTSSLMFGIQWDLVLKHIETKKGKTQYELKTKSTDWGNYLDATFDITKGKFSEDKGKTYDSVSGKYSKQQDKQVVLTTGSTTRNSTLNIYDISGNVWEWTLEQYILDSGILCTIRGSGCNYTGYNGPVYCRVNSSTVGSNDDCGFRPALW